jgi:ABC-2 type transport system ATP-binding protein
VSDFVIEAADLRKSYNEQLALNGLDLLVPAGSIFGFLGRNGAGKTTTIKLLMGLLRSNSGVAHVFGLSPSNRNSVIEIRRRTGFVPEDKELYPYMTVEQMIRFTRPFFSEMAFGSGKAVFEVVRASSTQKGSRSLERYAIEAHAASGDLAWCRTLDSR